MQEYLLPATLAEIHYVSSLGQKPCMEAYETAMYAALSHSILTIPFTWPQEIEFESLEQALSDLKWDGNHKAELLDRSDIDLLDWYAYLSPNATFEKKGSDCIGLAVYSVAWLRHKGIPARFCLCTPTHTVAEAYRGPAGWSALEPQDLMLARPSYGIVHPDEHDTHDSLYAALLYQINTITLCRSRRHEKNR